MKLISIVNSGESLEKTISLIYSAYKCNKDFYNQYEQIIVFYSKNIRKQKNNIIVMGTYKYFMNKSKLVDNELFSYQIALEQLMKKNKISYRQFKKKLLNKSKMQEFIDYIDWTEIYEDLELQLKEILYKKIPNLKIININNEFSISEIMDNLPHYQSFGKIYFYDYNGSTVSIKVGKDRKNKKIDRINKQSIYYTFNVYIFIVLIICFIKKDNLNNYVIGYRNMQGIYRKSYEMALDIIKKSNIKTIIEPRNTYFNSFLAKIPIRNNTNERTAQAVSEILNEILNERID